MPIENIKLSGMNRVKIHISTMLTDWLTGSDWKTTDYDETQVWNLT